MIPYLGELAAEDKMEKRGLLEHSFITTEAIHQALAPNKIFICGRKGAGKTAVISHLQQEHASVRRVTTVLRHKNYEAIQLNLAADIVDKFNVGPNAYQVVIIAYKGIWTYLLEVQVLFALHEAGQTGQSEGPLDDIGNFVRNTGTLSASLHVQRKIEALLRDQPAGGLSRTVFHSSLLMLSEDPLFKKARIQAHRLLTDVHLLLMIDTMEQYNIADVGLYPFQGLCEAVLDFHNEYSELNVQVKCFLPEEMTEHLFGQNRSKYRQHAVRLSWQYSELIQLIGVRYAHYLRAHVATEAAKELATRLEDNSAALLGVRGPRNRVARNTLWRLFAPERIFNRLGMDEDSCAHVFRHTQKRPREALCCMNHVLMQANGNEDLGAATAMELQPEHLIRGIHSDKNLDSLINDTLAAFAIQFQKEKASDVIKRIVNNEPRVFPHSLLRKIIKRAFQYQGFATEQQLKQFDTRALISELRRVLFRSGLVGEVERESTRITDAAGGKSMKYYCTRFEYVHSGLIEPNEQSTCAMHPMLADYIRAQDMSKPPGIVYPLPEEEDVQDGLT